jgi:hypothetical protein
MNKMSKNKQFYKGHVSKEGDYWFVNFYTCNGRCITIEDKHQLSPEIDKCCENIKFLLDKESQDKVGYHDSIYFTILDIIEHPFNNWIGLYAKYEGHTN